MRRTPEEDVNEEILKNAYQEFSGINLGKMKNSTWEQETVHMEEEILLKEM
ncbi:hypothetical protein LEP1GSC021_3813 [Leptospira noguchii str. 1993005606]|nr:hypothetical protein LEP1GSC021_3813 [Leptospira noguchii str. 1993005606]